MFKPESRTKVNLLLPGNIFGPEKVIWKSAFKITRIKRKDG